MIRKPEDAEGDLVAHLQTQTEREKALLARELHDDLGGLLVAASMDLAWLDRHIAKPSAPALRPSVASTPRPGLLTDSTIEELRKHLDRMRETLAEAVDMKRRIIEELRPTLLDNVGLFAALRWLVETSCARTHRASVISFPAREPHLHPDASIAVFRIVQEGIGVLVAIPWVGSLELRLVHGDGILTVCVTGVGEQTLAPLVAPPTDPPSAGSRPESYELASIRHRLAALGGRVAFSSQPGRATLRAWIPTEDGGTC